MGLNEIVKLIDGWHEHGVDMNLVENSRKVGNHWRKVNNGVFPKSGKDGMLR